MQYLTVALFFFLLPILTIAAGGYFLWAINVKIGRSPKVPVHWWFLATLVWISFFLVLGLSVVAWIRG